MGLVEDLNAKIDGLVSAQTDAATAQAARDAAQLAEIQRVLTEIAALKALVAAGNPDPVAVAAALDRISAATDAVHAAAQRDADASAALAAVEPTP